jgi:hypothetical protein
LKFLYKFGSNLGILKEGKSAAVTELFFSSPPLPLFTGAGVSSIAWARERVANHLAVATKVLATSPSSPSPFKPLRGRRFSLSSLCLAAAKLWSPAEFATTAQSPSTPSRS